jgi:hypothetical protein
VGVSQISEDVLAVLKDFNWVLNAALVVVTPKRENVAGIVYCEEDRSEFRAHVGVTLN